MQVGASLCLILGLGDITPSLCIVLTINLLMLLFLQNEYAHPEVDVFFCLVIYLGLMGVDLRGLLSPGHS